MEVRNVADCAGVPMEFAADLPPTAYEDLAERIVMRDRRTMAVRWECPLTRG